MAGEVDAQRLAQKRWDQRNSDGRFGWGGEDGGLEEMQAPPSFQETEYELPIGTVRFDNPEDDTEGRALLHVHVYDELVEEP